jgi:addiction module HigA family antidote
MTYKPLYNLHAGEILKTEFIDKTDINYDQLANAIAIPTNYIQQIIKGDMLITAEIDAKLCKFFALSEGYFLRLQIAYQTLQARRNISNR